MAQVDILSYEISQGLTGGYTSGEITVYITTKKETTASFYFHNGFDYLKTLEGKCYETHNTSAIIDSGNLSIPANKSSDNISLSDLEPNTSYTIWYKYVVPIDDEESEIITKTKELTTAKDLTLSSIGDFTFLYPGIKSRAGGNGHDVSGYSMLVSRIGSKNNYYKRSSYNWCVDIASGLTGFVVPNCVGFAHGRLKEIWGECITQKYIKKDTEGGYVVNSGRRITGDIKLECEDGLGQPTPCRCNAADWWANWPDKYNYPGWGRSQNPVPGAIMVGDEGGPGHVAVVEKVDYITGDVWASESWYGNVWHIGDIVKLTKDRGYTDSICWSKSTFKGFLISPACQLLSSLSAQFEPEIIIEINQVPVSERDQATWYELAHKHNIKLEESLDINDRVEIQWFGNSKADGTGRNVGNLSLVGIISKVNRSAELPYEVTVAKKIVGYYPRSSLVKTTAELSTSANSITDNVKTDNSILFSAKVTVDDLRIRSGASITSDILGTIPKGTIVNVYQVKSNGGYNGYKIDKSYDKGIANTQNRNDPDYPWVPNVTPEQTGVQSDYLYKVKVRIQVHVRSDHNVNSALVDPPRVKNPGEVLNVYEEYPLVDGKLSYDSDGYCWRRIDDGMWVADDSLSGDGLVDTKSTPSATTKAVGKLAVKEGIEMNIRTSPGISNNLSGHRVIGTGAIGPYYKVVKSVDGCDWYRISDDSEDPEGLGNKYDSDINSYYLDIY